MEQELKQLQRERKLLRDELIRVINLIKNCTDKDDRKGLFDWKNEVKMDIAEIETEIEEIKESERLMSGDEGIIDDREIIDDTELEQEPLEKEPSIEQSESDKNQTNNK